jgi:hypothetical protein
MPKDTKKLVLNQETLRSLTETGTKAADNFRSTNDGFCSCGDTDDVCGTC